MVRVKTSCSRIPHVDPASRIGKHKMKLPSGVKITKNRADETTHQKTEGNESVRDREEDKKIPRHKGKRNRRGKHKNNRRRDHRRHYRSSKNRRRSRQNRRRNQRRSRQNRDCESGQSRPPPTNEESEEPDYHNRYEREDRYPRFSQSMRDIRNQQRNTKMFLKRSSMERLLSRISRGFKSDFRWQEDSIAALME